MHLILEFCDDLIHWLHGRLCKLGCHLFERVRFLHSEDFAERCIYCRKRRETQQRGGV